MAYDEDLAGRVRALMADEDGLTERQMFGGLAFLLDGNMAVVVSNRGELMLRTDPDETPALLAEPGTAPTVMRGRELRGWLDVGPDAVAGEEDLARWVTVGTRAARSLPPKDHRG